MRWNFARGHALLVLSTFVFSGYSLNLAAQDGGTCKGPAGLEQAIKAHPSAGAYDALGAYFGQRQKISCAISAFESAVHLDRQRKTIGLPQTFRSASSAPSRDITVPTDKRAQGTTASWFRFIAEKR